MDQRIRYPTLYQINTPIYLTQLSRNHRRPATLDDIADSDLNALVAWGFDWVWLLGIWQTGPMGREVSRSIPEWRREYEALLPDFSEEDITGSFFSVADYSVHSNFGGDPALARLRERLKARGLKLMLDFVPNHTARDHRWVRQHPDYYVTGNEADLAREPWNYTRVGRSEDRADRADRIMAYGRDPYFPGWPDTFQLNYGHPAVQEAMIAELLKVAARCDGVRCDMAMLLLPEVFERTWGIKAAPFWRKAIDAVREQYPEFLFMAEVYWDLEWALQHQGFDYCYDKRLYDRLREGQARPVREHLRAGLDFQDRLARFLENHDEPRAAAVFPPEIHRAAAVITFLSPGLRFFHQGELEGKQKRVPVHLRRGPEEPVDEAMLKFYDLLLACLREEPFRQGNWRLLEAAAAWEGNGTFDHFIAYGWSGPNAAQRLVAVNFSSTQGQCYVRLPFPKLAGRTWRLQDRMGSAVYDRNGDDLLSRGLYLDMPAWGYHLFSVEAQVESDESIPTLLSEAIRSN